MFRIDYYSKPNGESPVRIFIRGLEGNISTDRNARIQYTQVISCIARLEEYGTRLGMPYTRHLEDGIWELRPGCNRILFFFFQNDTFVLLHPFRKRGQKTPRREIQRAKAERTEWIRRNS